MSNVVFVIVNLAMQTYNDDALRLAVRYLSLFISLSPHSCWKTCAATVSDAFHI